MSGMCKDCVHWELSDEYEARGWGFCGMGEGGFRSKEKNSKAYGYDSNGFYAQMYTAPDFGCVMHEAQEKPDEG